MSYRTEEFISHVLSIEERVALRRAELEQHLANVVALQELLKSNTNIVKAMKLMKSIFGERCL